MSGKPNAAARVAAYLLALLTALALLMAWAAFPAARLIADHALWKKAVTNDALIAAQENRFAAQVAALAASYGFAPETVPDHLPTLAEQNLAVADWWLSLWSESPETELPMPDTSAVEQAVREDEGFLAATPENMRRVTARDKIAYASGEALREASLPLRASVLSLAASEATARFDLPRLAAKLRRVPWFALGAGLLLTLGMAALLRRRAWFMLYAGSGLLAAGLTSGLMLVALALAGLPARLAAYSPILGAWLSALMTALRFRAAALTALFLLAGLLMQLLGLGKGRRTSARYDK